jgi:GT2 family glycosyltransferase
MNVALGQTDAPFVLCLNPDARPRPDFVTRLLETFLRHSSLKVGAVTGRLSRLNNSASSIIDAAGMHLTMSWRHLDRGSSQIDRGQYRAAARVFGATGAASLFKREALDDVAVNGEVFLPEFHSYREDAELCFRLRERGWEVVYEPTAHALHGRVNLPKRRREMSTMVNYHSLKNRYLLRVYHQTMSNFFLTLLPTLIRDALIVAYVLTRERSSLEAYRWLWRHRHQMWARRRQIQGRRTLPARETNRWFFRSALPL